MAELRASPVVNPSYKRIADVLANLQGPMGEIIPFTDANPFKFLMPAASTFENLAYGNSPFSEYAGVTNRRLPIVKTGRENELTDIADVALMASGLPMASRGVARGANYLGDVLTQATRAAPPAAPMRGLEKAYAEAEQRIAGLVEPQAGVRGFNIVQPGDMVSGLTVRKDVPNMSSIAASLDDYEILSGIREVPRNAFDPEYLGSLSYDKLDQRTKDLAEQIRQSKEINPVIVGMDSKGAYIIEGGHRFDALMSQDTKSIPALVVIDKSDPPAAPMRAVSEIAEAAPITPKPPPPEPLRSDIGFYSQLEAATNPLQDKGTGDQFLSQLQKSAGVKPDEIKYTGLDEFLKGKKAVTKAEIQGYLASNKVDVQEVRLGDQDFSKLPDTQLQQEYERFRGYKPVDTYGDPMSREEMLYELSAASQKDLTKFSQHTLPGGENYRELLLTLPDTKGARLDARRAEIEAKGRNATDAEKQEWSSIMNQLQPETRDVEGLSPFRNRPEFRTIHFDQPNILAHMRVNDRTVDGKKTLFIEEIQSDWHQKGRKKGYGPQTETTHEAFYTTPDGQKVSLGFGKTQEEAAAAVDPNWKNLVDIKFDSQTVKVDEGVPDAPFKTSWHELSLKRAIQEASEKGYDQIAFTTGKTQAERYDLSKQVDYIDYKTTRSGPDIQYGLAVVAKNGDSVDLPKQFFTAKELPDIVGKEVADKIIAGQGQPGGGRMTLRGLDLKVGGEGMKGFYDQILPKSLEKLGKKFDAKVGKTQMDGVEVWQMDITPKMRESVTTKGQPLFSISGLGAGAIGSGFYQDDTMEQLSR
jgi:hypothetical protein